MKKSCKYLTQCYISKNKNLKVFYTKSGFKHILPPKEQVEKFVKETDGNLAELFKQLSESNGYSEELLEDLSYQKTKIKFRKDLEGTAQRLSAGQMGSGRSLHSKWFEDVKYAIGKEIKYIGYEKFFHVQLDQAASIGIQECLNIALYQNGERRSVDAFQKIGSDIYAQYCFAKLKKEKKKVYFPKGDQRYIHSVIRTAESMEGFKPWERSEIIQLGGIIVKSIVDVVKIPDQGDEGNPLVPAFEHSVSFDDEAKVHSQPRKRGYIGASISLMKYLQKHQIVQELASIRYLPMVTKPLPWVSPTTGGYHKLPVDFLRRKEGSEFQRYVLKEAILDDLFHGLDILSGTAWKINKPVLDTIEALWAEGGGLCAIPSKSDVDLPESPDEDDIDFEEKLRVFKRETRKATRTNRNLHSLRCDQELKLQVARDFVDKTFYFPHNIDFRGRSYPIPPHLNQVGADFNRGLLLFAETRKIGTRGIYWLKIHLANVIGKDKLSFDGRINYINNNMERIMNCADDPLAHRWWTMTENPFQTLASCIELTQCLRSPKPEDFESSIPVQMDGSCNGLQHYAALGRDILGALHVNLLPTEKPMDVYSGVLEIVKKYMKYDSKRGNKYARILQGHVHRKTIKQTVMTTVYGVTLIGAKDQIARQLRDKKEIPSDDNTINGCALYLAKTAFKSLGEVFGSAQRIMGWLNECAYLIARTGKPVIWHSPIGLPIVQPYRNTSSYQVKTVLQNVTLEDVSDAVPIHRIRQKNAFPPNYVHSLDATHMFLTALACHDDGLCFSSVHDSFWTHAGNTDDLNRILRDEFVKLHQQPLLETLMYNFEELYPDIKFPPIPLRGNLNVERVKGADYFFD